MAKDTVNPQNKKGQAEQVHQMNANNSQQNNKQTDRACRGENKSGTNKNGGK